MRIPYGFTLTNNGILEINRSEADNVALVFDLYMAGASLGKVADKQNPLFECIYRKAGLYLRNRSDALFVRSKRGFNGTTGKIMRASAERRCYERQKTCGLWHNVPGIDRDSRAKDLADD